ncbi:MAG: hypothetical protein AB7R89_02355 [Dehalococcoidia bacterium]
MQQIWRAAPAGTLLVLAATIAAIVGASAQPVAAADAIETRTVSSYDVNADGSIHVTIAAQVTNRDPSTQRRASGRVLFYSAVAFAVHDAAANLTARSGTTRLTTESTGTSRTEDPFRLIAVRFDRDLYYNESVSIALEYDLSAVRARQLLVNDQYAFVPAVGQGTYSLVRITAPAGRHLTIGSANCVHTADTPTTYSCGESTTAADYGAGGRCAYTADAPQWDCAFTGDDFVVIPFEATAAGLAMATRASRTALSGATIQVKVSYFTGDETWAARVEDIVRRGLPLLEEANGFPYPGPSTIEIVESGYRDTHGYEGLANHQGRIRLTPVADDQTILHEISHMWSGVFASRWLAEGMADFTANVAAQTLNIRPTTVPQPLPSAPVLEEWGALRRQIVVNSDERELEESGYARSLRFVEILAERAGPDALRDANATLARDGLRASARTYLDVLEDITGAGFAPLFADWAFTPSDIELLPARADARAAAAELQRQAGPSGMSRPQDLAEALRNWDFARAQRLITIATEALDAHAKTAARAGEAGYGLGDRFATTYARSAEEAGEVARLEADALAASEAAGDRLHDERSLVMRVGLFGRDLTDDAAGTREALAQGELETAIERSAALQRRLDTADRDGIIRLAVTALALVALLGLFALRQRALNRRRRAAIAGRSVRPPRRR